MKWINRNEDKPHRCPECHSVATWNRRSHGPRTRVVCPNGCGVQWRMGDRLTRKTSLWWKRRESGGLCIQPNR